MIRGLSDHAPACEPRESLPASVVVLAYNKAEVIERALRALRNQQFAEPFEVIVVWSGDPDTAGIARAVMPDAEVIGREERIPTGAGRNLGVETASGEVIAFLAADCVPDQHWLARRVAGHRQGFTAVGGAVICSESSSAMAKAAHLIEYLDSSPHRPRQEVKGQPIFNLSFQREVFARHGPYDEDLACGEDAEFNRRLAESGERVLFDPEVKMSHRGPSTLRDYLRHQYWHGSWLGWLHRNRSARVDAHRTYRSAMGLALFDPIVRVARGVRRIFAWERHSLLQAVLLTPLMLLGLGAASLGAVRVYLRADSGPPLHLES